MNKIQKTPYDCSLPPGQAAGRVASAVSLLADNKLLITTGGLPRAHLEASLSLFRHLGSRRLESAALSLVTYFCPVPASLSFSSLLIFISGSSSNSHLPPQ